MSCPHFLVLSYVRHQRVAAVSGMEGGRGEKQDGDFGHLSALPAPVAAVEKGEGDIPDGDKVAHSASTLSNCSAQTT